MSQSLMKRAEDKLALWQLIEESHGELNETLENWLTEVEHHLAKKVDNYKWALDELESESDRMRAESQLLLKGAQSIDRIRSALHDRIKFTMSHLECNEMIGNSYRFKLSNGQKKLVIDIDKLPKSYIDTVVTEEIDRERVRKDLEDGKSIEGVSLEETLQLRTYLNKGKK